MICALLWFLRQKALWLLESFPGEAGKREAGGDGWVDLGEVSGTNSL